jgi:hypothetical protein
LAYFSYSPVMAPAAYFILPLTLPAIGALLSTTSPSGRFLSAFSSSHNVTYPASPRVKRPIHHIPTTLWRGPQGHAEELLGLQWEEVRDITRESSRLPDGERRLVLGIVRQLGSSGAAGPAEVQGRLSPLKVQRSGGAE